MINCARAELINDNDLIKAIQSKKISYAAIDVINPEPNYDKKKNSFKHKLLKTAKHVKNKKARKNRRARRTRRVKTI